MRDHPFQHPLNSPNFDLDAPYEFPLSWLHPDVPGHPFPNGPYLFLTQSMNQAALEPNLMDAHVPKFDSANAYYQRYLLSEIY
ncbi:hypothetical protein AHAS_Ahas02G0087700 [Arachis hypogaea]